MSNTPPRFAAIVLAAGESARMGQPKALLRFGSRTMLDLALAAVSMPEIDATVLVLGAHGQEIRKSAWLDEVEVVENAAWREGMLTSVQTGLRTLAASPGGLPDYCVVMPCDYALVRHTTVCALLLRAATANPRPPLISPSFYGRTGHPIVIGREVMEAALKLDRSLGLDAAVHAFRDEREVVEVDDAAIHFDIDTPEDYQAAMRAHGVMEDARTESSKFLSR